MIDKKTSELKLRRINLALWVSIIVLVLAAALCYFLLDRRVFSLLVKYPNTWDENVWLRALKRLGKAWVLIWLLLLWVCVARRPRPALIGLLAMLLLIPAVLPLKVLVRRPRPREVIAASSQVEENNGPQRTMSFPSGDTANAFAVAAALLSFVAWPWILVLFTAAGGISLLRVTTMAHYPSDVCAGAAIGMFSGWLALQITRGWMSQELSRFNRCRVIAGAGVIVLPFLISLFEKVNPLLVFLKTYWWLIVCIYLLAKASDLAKR